MLVRVKYDDIIFLQTYKGLAILYGECDLTAFHFTSFGINQNPFENLHISIDHFQKTILFHIFECYSQAEVRIHIIRNFITIMPNNFGKLVIVMGWMSW